MSEQPGGFLEAITAWLRSNGEPSATALKVEPQGTDWAGDTLTGLHGAFDVWVSFVRDDGTTGSVNVEGESMASLWDAVVLGYGQKGTK